LWGRLYHQGDTYTAAYAVLPHLVRLQTAAAEPSWSAIALIAAIEIARAKGRGPAIPIDFTKAYHAALRAIPEALAKRLTPKSSELLTRSVLAAVAAAAGLELRHVREHADHAQLRIRMRVGHRAAADLRFRLRARQTCAYDRKKRPSSALQQTR
jgi:hypothetical protein